MLARWGRENSPRKSAKGAHLNLFHIWSVVSDANYVASSAACSAGWDLKWKRTECWSGKHARWHEQGKKIHTVALKRSTNCGLFAAISHWTWKKSAFCDRIAIGCRFNRTKSILQSNPAPSRSSQHYVLAAVVVRNCRDLPWHVCRTKWRADASCLRRPVLSHRARRLLAFSWFNRNPQQMENVLTSCIKLGFNVITWIP